MYVECLKLYFNIIIFLVTKKNFNKKINAYLMFII